MYKYIQITPEMSHDFKSYKSQKATFILPGAEAVKPF